MMGIRFARAVITHLKLTLSLRPVSSASSLAGCYCCSGRLTAGRYALELPATLSMGRRRRAGADEAAGLRTVDTIPPGAQQAIAWSPDSNRIAFVSERSKQNDLTLASRTRDERTTLPMPSPPAGGRLRLGNWNANGENGVILQIPQVGNDFYMVPSMARAFRESLRGPRHIGWRRVPATWPRWADLVLCMAIYDGGRAHRSSRPGDRSRKTPDRRRRPGTTHPASVTQRQIDCLSIGSRRWLEHLRRARSTR